MFLFVGQRRTGRSRGAAVGCTAGPRRGVELSFRSASNSRRLVLGCIDSYDSEQRRIFLHFSRSTRFASFCTILISEILQICVKILLIFAEISQKFSKILQKSKKIRKLSRKKCEKSANFEIGAVQKNANLVDLEKCCKMRLCSLS